MSVAHSKPQKRLRDTAVPSVGVKEVIGCKDVKKRVNTDNPLQRNNILYTDISRLR